MSKFTLKKLLISNHTKVNLIIFTLMIIQDLISEVKW